MTKRIVMIWLLVSCALYKHEASSGLGFLPAQQQTGWTKFTTAPTESVAKVLSLRGGYSLIGKRRRAMDGGVRTQKRIHGARRPHGIRRRQAKEKLAQESADPLEFNETKAMEEDRASTEPWPVRYGECTWGEWAKEISDYKRECPEVFEEVSNTRMDNYAMFELKSLQELADYVPEHDDDLRWYHAIPLDIDLMRVNSSTEFSPRFKERENRPDDERMKILKGSAHQRLGLFWEIGYAVPGPDLKKAFEHWLAGAKLGDPDCMCNAGLCLVSGQGAELNELQAFTWFKKSAEIGCPEGEFNLGLCYRDGVGTLPDPELAIRWFNRSADAVSPSAMFELARLHEEGFGSIPKNPGKAVALYSRLLDKFEHPQGQMRLALLFLQGIGVEADREMAMKLVAKSASNGFPEAREFLESLIEGSDQTFNSGDGMQDTGIKSNSTQTVN